MSTPDARTENTKKLEIILGNMARQVSNEAPIDTRGSLHTNGECRDLQKTVIMPEPVHSQIIAFLATWTGCPRDLRIDVLDFLYARRVTSATVKVHAARHGSSSHGHD